MEKEKKKRLWEEPESDNEGRTNEQPRRWRRAGAATV